MNPHDIDTWNFKELTLASKEYIDHLWNYPRFFRKLQFMDNAQEALNILKEDFDIEIATMGYTPNLIGKEIWIHDHMPYIQKIHLIDSRVYPDKAHIDMSGAIYIDDNSKILNSCNTKQTICFGNVYPWNRDWGGLRCSNWYDVIAELLLNG